MDPSALIFVALAVAWAAYLIPKALEHHEESARSRSIDRFSHRLRILARREPVGRRTSALVTVADQVPEPVPAPEPVVTLEEFRMSARAWARGYAAAARRRRRVLELLLLVTAVVAATAVGGRLAWVWLGVPAGLVLLWLVVCRVSVRRQRRRRLVRPARPVDVPLLADPAAAPAEVLHDTGTDTGAGLLVPADGGGEASAAAPGWDPLPIVVPTYVAKEQVRRSVRTIELDSTGVWSSGRSEIDSALVRDSDAAARAERDARQDRDDQDDQADRAVGS